MSSPECMGGVHHPKIYAQAATHPVIKHCRLKYNVPINNFPMFKFATFFLCLSRLHVIHIKFPRIHVVSLLFLRKTASPHAKMHNIAPKRPEAKQTLEKPLTHHDGLAFLSIQSIWTYCHIVYLHKSPVGISSLQSIAASFCRLRSRSRTGAHALRLGQPCNCSQWWAHRRPWWSGQHRRQCGSRWWSCPQSWPPGWWCWGHKNDWRSGLRCLQENTTHDWCINSCS